MTAPAASPNVPFVVSNLITLTQGAVIPFNSQLLAPPFRTPYLIKELRFFSGFLGSPRGPAVPKFQNVQIALGHKSMTHKFVPLGLLCPEVQLATDEAFGPAGVPFSLFRWVLPKPMYCRAGEGIFASAQNTFTIANLTWTVELSVVGEMLPPGAPVPKTSCVPYVAAYSTGGASPAAASDGVGLRNPWPDKILNMQRFIGRGYSIVSVEGSPEGWADADLTDTSAPIVTLVDSDVRTSILSAQGVLFGEAFDARTGCLEHRRPLSAKGWFQTSLTNISSNSTYGISMIGWREEALS